MRPRAAVLAFAVWATGCATGVIVTDGTGGAVAGGVGGTAVVPGTGGTVAAGTGGAVASGAGGRTGTGGAAAPPDGGAGALLSDGFESAGVDARWITDPALGGSCGDWAVVTDGATHAYEEQTSCSSPSWAAGGDTRWTDVTMQLRAKVVSASSSSAKVVLAVRFQDEKNYYFLEYSTDGKIKLRSKIAGSSTDLATNDSDARVPVATGAWVNIGLGVSGPSTASTVSAYLDGTPVLSGTATGLAAGGVALGAQSGAMSFDDVVVTGP